VAIDIASAFSDRDGMPKYSEECLPREDRPDKLRHIGPRRGVETLMQAENGTDPSAIIPCAEQCFRADTVKASDPVLAYRPGAAGKPKCVSLQMRSHVGNEQALRRDNIESV
jgi:hypothetical protein